MGKVICLKDFLNDYGESMAEKVTRELTVIHDPITQKEEQISKILDTMKKRPFPSQDEIVKACCKTFISGNKAAYIVAECGTGKTIQSIACGYVLHRLKGVHRVLVLCPPTLVRKWIAEIKDSLVDVKAYNLNGKDVITQLNRIRKLPKPLHLEFYVIGRERAKTGFLWRPAVLTRCGKYFCPKCGNELHDKDGYVLPVFEQNIQCRYKRRYVCQNPVEKYKYNPESRKFHKTVAICGEPLWQPDTGRKNYRKVIPAKFIKAKMKGFFDLLIADEVHQFKNESGQGYAFGALACACKYVLCLTGTLAGGYASDVYHLLFRTHPHIMLEDTNKWGNPKGFIERYGVLEKITTVRQEDGLTTKARRRTVVKEKPGISPLLLGKLLLSNSVFLRLSDCMDHLQPYEEEVIELCMPPDMAQFYTRFEDQMKQALKDALARGDNSLLGAYLHALLSYPERIYKGVKVIHPHTKEPVAYGPPLDGIMPKEHELISIIKQELEQKRKVLVYFQNSNTTDISPRLVSMFEEENINVKVLRSSNTEGRAQIIKRWVDQGLEVLFTNPKKVEVGMDLLDFPSIIFYQIPMSTYTLRQASRRSWRIPQTRPVKVFFLTYSATMQTRLMQLMAEKLMTSLAVEGELSDKGLAALSETSDSMAKELARMLVEKSESGEQKGLKDIWADYRKKEVQVEVQISNNITSPQPGPEAIAGKQKPRPTPEVKQAGSEVTKIGEKLVKIEFTEYTGKRKKKVTRIEVTHAELDEMIKDRARPVQVQYTLF
jgi:hypothetical protein